MTINIWTIVVIASILLLIFIILHFIERRGVYMFPKSQNKDNPSPVSILFDNNPEPPVEPFLTMMTEELPSLDLEPPVKFISESVSEPITFSAPTVSIPTEPISPTPIIQAPVALSQPAGKEQLIGYQVKKYLMALLLKVNDQDWEGIQTLEGFTSSFRDALIDNFQNHKTDIPIPKTPNDYAEFVIEKEEGIYILSYSKQHWMCLDNGITFIICGFYQG